MTSPTNVTGPSGGTGFVLGDDEGDGYFWLGSLTINKVGSSQTLSGLSIVDHRVPAGYAPPAHQHHDDETFYILEGQFAVRCGEHSWLAGPGSLVFLPRDIPHGFVVSDAGPGRTLLITAPTRSSASWAPRRTVGRYPVPTYRCPIRTAFSPSQRRTASRARLDSDPIR
jgi:quercetin dioxygenase-like cupin family protein